MQRGLGLNGQRWRSWTNGWLPGRPHGHGATRGTRPLSTVSTGYKGTVKNPRRPTKKPSRSARWRGVLPGRPYSRVMGDRVLVVDDELAILRVVAANLRARGYEALTAATGEDALTVLEAQEPDCIVLDLGLPDVSGLEVLRRLRTWTTTPVVILTAADDEHRRTMAFDLGVDDYVTKPFAMGDLLARVRGAVQQGRSRNPDRPRRIEVGPVCIDL